MDKIVEKKIYNTLLISITLTFLLFTTSLGCNAYYINDGENSVGSLGLLALVLGFFGMNVSWLANPCLIMSLVHLKRENVKKAFIFSLVAVLFGLSFLLYDKIIANEGGGKTKITAYGLGYWFWLSSLVVNFIGIATINILLKKLPPT